MASRFEMTDFIKETSADLPRRERLRMFGHYAAQLSGEQKAQFFLLSAKSDQASEMFFFGHAVASISCSILTIGAGIAADVYSGVWKITPALVCIALPPTLVRSSHSNHYSAREIENADFRMGQRNTVVSPYRAFVAGLVNGCKHNAATATLRLAASVACNIGALIASIPSETASGVNFFFSPEKKWGFTRKANAFHDWFDKMGVSVLGKTTFVSADLSRSEVPARIAEWHAAPKGKSSQPA